MTVALPVWPKTTKQKEKKNTQRVPWVGFYPTGKGDNEKKRTWKTAEMRLLIFTPGVGEYFKRRPLPPCTDILVNYFWAKQGPENKKSAIKCGFKLQSVVHNKIQSTPAAK